METISRLLLTFLLNALWQVALVAALASVGGWLLRSAPARYRHRVWVAALVLSCALAALTCAQLGTQFFRSPPKVVTASLPAADLSATVPAASLPVTAGSAHKLSAATSPADPPAARFAAQPTLPVRRDLATLAILAYFGLLLYQSICLLRAWQATRVILRGTYPVTFLKSQREIAARCREATGVRRVRILGSRELSVPATVGWLRPAVILPEQLLQGGDPEMLASALGHELVHVARRDYLLNCFYLLLYLPFSFHPAAALVKRRINQTRELRCDEFVTEKLMDAAVYARSLVELAAHALPAGRPLATMTVGITDGDILEERIMAMLRKPKLSARKRNLLLTAALACLVVPCLAAAPLELNVIINPEPNAAQSQSPQPVVTKPAGPAELAPAVAAVEVSPAGWHASPGWQEVTPKPDQEAQEKAETQVRERTEYQVRADRKKVEALQRELVEKIEALQREHSEESEAQIAALKQRLEFLQRAQRENIGVIFDAREHYKTKLATGGDTVYVMADMNSPEAKAPRREEEEMFARRRADMARAAKITMAQAIQIATSHQAGSVVECRLESGVAGGVTGGVAGGVTGGVAGGVTGGVAGGVAGGVVGGVSGGGEHDQVFYLVTIVPAGGGPSQTVVVNALDGKIVGEKHTEL